MFDNVYEKAASTAKSANLHWMEFLQTDIQLYDIILIFDMTLISSSMESWIVTEKRFKFSLAMTCGLLSALFLFPGLRFAKCYVQSLAKARKMER